METALQILERHLRTLEIDVAQMKKEGKDASKEEYKCEELRTALMCLKNVKEVRI